jgi:hypothetical protein
MEKLFTNYKVSQLAKDKGFDEECLSSYYSYPYSDGVFKLAKYVDSHKMEVGMKLICKAPTHQQIVDWLEEKHNIHVSRIWYNDGVTPTRWVYHIDGDYVGSDFDEALIQALTRIK